MYLVNEQLVLSASDLVGHLLCPHLTSLSLDAAREGRPLPERTDPELDVLASRGLAHEAAYLDELESSGITVVRIDDEGSSLADLDNAAARTMAAMRDGVDVVFQAAFLDDTVPGTVWRGHADFLRRVDRPSSLGAHSYEPEDTKLARHVHPSAVLQLCHYAEQVERVQGLAPESIHVVMGDRTRESLLLRDFGAYYRAAKARFVEVCTADTRHETYPLPVAHCAVCRWEGECDARRHADDHLCLIPNLTRDQARKLTEKANISTVTTLAEGIACLGPIGIGPATLERHARQARLQVAHRADSSAAPPWEFYEQPDRDRGLGALPLPDPGDVFFDIEGDPFVGEAGLEYLLGVGWEENGSFEYRSYWSHNPAEERGAFEEFIDWLLERRVTWPGMHVYHYAPYEPAALGRLMGRYATREEELDRLLRARVFVDLYRVVRQGLVIGTASYSLKKLEPLYMAGRADEIADAASSIVAYERWLHTADPSILDELERYNRTDCESTWRLREWLENRRADAEGQFGAPVPRPLIPEDAPPEGVAAHSAEVAELVERLTADMEEPPDDSAPPDLRSRWLLANLLDWHRREAKPEWWRYFHRVLDCTDDDLFDDTEAVAGLEYDGVIDIIKKSHVHRYRFDPDQEHKLLIGTGPLDPASERRELLDGDKTPAPGTLVDLDPVEGWLCLKRGATSLAPHPAALIPPGPIGTATLRDALARLGGWVAENGIDAGGPWRAARDLLLRLPPRLSGIAPGSDLVRSGEDSLQAAVRLSAALDGGCLPIQGPPGSGKTYIAARVVVALASSGRRVGISANSHAVISHLLAEVMVAARQEGATVRAIQKVSDDGDGCIDDGVTCTKSNDAVRSALADGDVNVVAGTAWLFSRVDLEGSLDHLVIDEAGQLSLANVCSIAGAARNLILIGDPQQLAQPSMGSHPLGAEVSALEHALDGFDTVPPDKGLFVESTRRLHPDICTFVSETSYDGRLRPLEGLEQQRIDDGPQLGGAGLRWRPVEHAGNRTTSIEEAHEVEALYGTLLGRTWIDAEGVAQPVAADDILVVAPYNAQVHLLHSVLPAGARVGTVDKFQGQEAAVVFVSLAASSAQDTPRGMEFLYSRNRLNVAISRARALCVVVASPALLEPRCRSVNQLRLANGLCRFVELASLQHRG